MKYKHILFDLDGTLSESGTGIINSYEYTLKAYGIEHKREDLAEFVGPPLRDNLLKYLKEGHNVDDYIKTYREYYSEHGIFENDMYPGIKNMLEKFSEEGYKLHVASSKATFYIEKVLKHFGIFEFFTSIGGDHMEGGRGEKIDIINYVLDMNNIADKSSVIMVGDRKYDILGAKECGVESIGVLFGYGSREELEEAGAAYIAESPQQIWEIISGQQ